MSEKTSEENPRRAVNLPKAARKASEVKSNTSSIRTALVERHTKRHA